MKRCCYEGCGFEHRSEVQVKLHEAMSRHCDACQKSDLDVEFTALTHYNLCDDCYSKVIWADESGMGEDV